MAEEAPPVGIKAAESDSNSPSLRTMKRWGGESRVRASACERVDGPKPRFAGGLDAGKRPPRACPICAH